MIDLRTGELLPHNPEYYMTHITNVGYSGKTDCLQWLSFLDYVFLGGKALVEYMQMLAVYTLTGSTQEQCMAYMYGNGRNGKSTYKLR